MNDDIERTIREAMAGELSRFRPSLDGEDRIQRAADLSVAAAGLAAAVRLMRESGLPPGWSPRMWGSDDGSVFLEGDGQFRAWSYGVKIATCPTLAEAIAAIEARHADR